MGTSVPMQGDGIPQDSQQAAQCIIKVPGQRDIHEDDQDLLLLVPYDWGNNHPFTSYFNDFQFIYLGYQGFDS